MSAEHPGNPGRLPPLPRITGRRADDPAETARREERRRRAALDNQLRQLIGARSADPATASRYDLLADALMNVVTDRIFAAIHSPDFPGALHDRGYAVAVLPDGETVPAPPEDWADDATDLIGGEGDWSDPLGRIDDLWTRAFLAGYAAAEAEHNLAGEGEHDPATRAAGHESVASSESRKVEK